tara:strand:- start:176 stop:478 length:303 start_codon:yes stop_codon:yes gene_type:complete
MYLAMNRFKIVIGKEDEFEALWKNSETHLDGIKGFKRFNLIKGYRNKECSLYVSHTKWNSENDFINWTKSQSFKLAYKNTISDKNLYLGPPHYEGFEIII